MGKIRKFARGTIRAAIVVSLALVLAACASMGADSEKKKTESLRASVEAFNAAFRWEDYSTALAFVPEYKREQFWNAVDMFKGKIRIIEYQVREVDEKPMAPTSTAILYFQYWRTDAPTLQTVNLTQRWAYMEKEKAWKIVDSGFRAFTKGKSGL